MSCDVCDGSDVRTCKSREAENLFLPTETRFWSTILDWPCMFKTLFHRQNWIARKILFLIGITHYQCLVLCCLYCNWISLVVVFSLYPAFVLSFRISLRNFQLNSIQVKESSKVWMVDNVSFIYRSIRKLSKAYVKMKLQFMYEWECGCVKEEEGRMKRERTKTLGFDDKGNEE